MHFERLAIEAGASTFTLEFHPRLTVVAGVGQLERDGLVNEMVSGLSAGRAGVHLEVRSDAGERYAIFRPSSGPARVVDIDNATDVTNRFTDEAGRVNILERAGLDVPAAKRSMRVTSADMATGAQRDDVVERLAQVDPNRLWDVARTVLDREARLSEAAEAVGSVAEDVEMVEEIERLHGELESLQQRAERARRGSFLLAGTMAVLAFLALVTVGTVGAFVLLGGAIAALGYSLTWWWRVEQARRAEDRALERAGARSYLLFQVERVNSLVSSEAQRQRLMDAAAAHRGALAQWELLAGDVSVAWALEHRREIVAAHGRLREAYGLSNPMALSLNHAVPSSDSLELAFVHHLDRLKHLGVGGESFPAFLDDPFLEAASGTKEALLAVALQRSRHQQVVMLTDDPEVVAWARLEAVSGDLTLIEPAAREERRRRDKTTRDKTTRDKTPKRSRHVAA